MLLLYIISFCIFEIETADFKNYLGFSIIGGVLVETTFPCSLFLGIFGHVGFIHGWLSICLGEPLYWTNPIICCKPSNYIAYQRNQRLRKFILKYLKFSLGTRIRMTFMTQMLDNVIFIT